MLKRLQRPENQAARLNHMAAQFENFQTADTYLRNFTLSKDLGITNTTFEDDIADILGELQEVVAQAKDGSLMTLRSPQMGNLERSQLLQIGRTLLQATDMQPTVQETDTLQSLFMPEDQDEKGIILPSVEFQTFRLFQLSLVYLSHLRSITYRNLTQNKDAQVGNSVLDEKTFWQFNTTPQDIMLRIGKIQTAMCLIEAYPQVIFSNKDALGVCHFVAMIAKFGRANRVE